MQRMINRFAIVLLAVFFIASQMGCSNEKKADTAQMTDAEKISDEKALSGIKKYCYAVNPDLENIVKAGEYPVYWELISSDEQEIVVLFRAYTGAQKRYYINRINGNTYATEYVPGITDEEQMTDESFNITDYF